MYKGYEVLGSERWWKTQKELINIDGKPGLSQITFITYI